MALTRSIQTEEEFDRAVARLWELFDAEPGTPEWEEKTELADMVEAYDDEHYPIEPLTLARTIVVRLEDAGLTPDALIPCIGSRELVNEVLAGQREVTPQVAEALYQKLNIDVRDLLPQHSTPPAND